MIEKGKQTIKDRRKKGFEPLISKWRVNCMLCTSMRNNKALRPKKYFLNVIGGELNQYNLKSHS
jgi:hypothetical protein